MHGSLVHSVDGETGLLELPNNGSQIDDGAATEALHLRQNSLRSEKHMTLVDGDAIVPVSRRDLFRGVTIIIAGIVDEHGDIAKVGTHFFDSALQSVDIANVAGNK